MSASLTRRRYARRASDERIFLAQAVSSDAFGEAPAGRHRKIFFRLAVSPAPFGLYGPSTIMLARPGPSGLDDVSVISVTVAPYSLRGGCSTPSASHDLPTKETPTMC